MPLRFVSLALPSSMAALLLALACGPKEPTNPPEPVSKTDGTAKPDDVAKPDGEAKPDSEARPDEPDEPDAKTPSDVFTIGAFNLDWAYDNIDKKRPKQAKPHVAPDDTAWEWKRDRIAEVLVAQKLDIVVITEAGGDREIGDITSTVKDKGWHAYDYAWVQGEDKLTGKQVAILSRFPLSGERRTEAYAPMHVAADVELPTGVTITVIGLHLKEGKLEAAAKQRLEMAGSLKRRASKERKKNPVVIAGTVGDPTLPFDDGYKTSAAGVLAGKSCQDSAKETLAQHTTVGDAQALDRIFTCGLEMRAAEIGGTDLIVRQEEDPNDSPWPSVPVDEAPHRDVSDHLVVWAEVVMPTKAEAAPAGEDEAGEGE
jgi:endonuclease/exonuclease/phosphatase family metal-dependent hydrolase